MRLFRLFFFSPSAPDAAGLEVFFAALVPSVVFAGALEAVEAGALPAVEAGLGAIAEDDMIIGVFVRKGCRARGVGVKAERWRGNAEAIRGIYTDALSLFGPTRRRAEPYFVERHQHHHVSGPCRVFPAPALV